MLTLEVAMRLSEVLLALAFLQQSAEHIFGIEDSRLLFIPRAVLSIVLLLGFYSPWVLLMLTVHSLLILHRFQGPYNGGSCIVCAYPAGFRTDWAKRLPLGIWGCRSSYLISSQDKSKSSILSGAVAAP